MGMPTKKNAIFVAVFALTILSFPANSKIPENWSKQRTDSGDFLFQNKNKSTLILEYGGKSEPMDQYAELSEFMNNLMVPGRCGGATKFIEKFAYGQKIKLLEIENTINSCTVFITFGRKIYFVASVDAIAAKKAGRDIADKLMAKHLNSIPQVAGPPPPPPPPRLQKK
jgi:hypothetical protein